MPKLFANIIGNVVTKKNKSTKNYKRLFSLEKSKGQHLLKSDKIVSQIISSSKLKPGESVLEIGAGTGNLTLPLARKCRFIHAIELDPRMCMELKKKLSENNLLKKVKVLNEDFCKLSIPKFDKCISNIPYKISSKVVFNLLTKFSNPIQGETENAINYRTTIKERKFSKAVIMFQKEFAERLTVVPGDKNYSRLSACVSLLSKTVILFKVPKKNFSPPPLVDSCVVMLKPNAIPYSFFSSNENIEKEGKVEKKENEVDDIEKRKSEFIRKYFTICRMIFNRKNKTLRASLCSKKSLEKFKKWGITKTKEEFLNELDKINFEIVRNSKKRKNVKKEIMNISQVRARFMNPKNISELIKTLNKMGFSLGDENCNKKDIENIFEEEMSDESD